jgi:hypothetical protein
VVVNQVIDVLFDDEERRTLLAEPHSVSNDPGDEGIAAAVRRAQAERVQTESMHKIEAGIPAPVIELPRLLEDPSTPGAVAALARLLAERLFGAAKAAPAVTR